MSRRDCRHWTKLTLGRLGSSLEGAFLIWDDLLRKVAVQLPGFQHALTYYMLHVLTDVPTTDPQTDVEKEALAMWILHLPSLKSQDVRDLSLETIKSCCLHPGYWTRRVGEETLRNADYELRIDWQDMFQASSIENVSFDKADNEDEANAVQQSAQAMVEKTDNSSQEGLTMRGWTEAVIAPSTAVGVVP